MSSKSIFSCFIILFDICFIVFNTCNTFSNLFKKICAISMKSAPCSQILTILNSNPTSIFRLVGLRYRHNVIVLYNIIVLHVINHIILFSVSYFTSFISMVNVKINYFHCHCHFHYLHRILPFLFGYH